MLNRPKINLPLTGLQLKLEVLAFALLAALWAYVLFVYGSLPNSIPMHFNTAGQVDNWGNKNTIFLMPTLATVICVGFYFLCKVPHIHNYMVNITPENAAYQYSNSTLLLRVVKVMVMVLFLLAINKTIAVVTNQASLPWAVFYFAVIAIVATPVVFIYRMFANK
jgi:uncharacterized membrane protein